MRRVAALLGLAAALIVGLLAWANHSPPQLPPGARATEVVVIKHQRRLTLLQGSQIMADFPVSLGGRPRGHKQREGDERTPEGRYVIDYHNPRSAFFRSLHISYPSSADTARARKSGVSPGGMIMIHGLPPRLAWLGRLHLAADWTDGCIALTNPEMKQVFAAVGDGTPIQIQP